MNYLVVTSFSREGFYQYGKQMIKSFQENWNDINCKLWVFVDDFPDEAFQTDVDRVLDASPNVEFFDMSVVALQQSSFETRHQSPICHGIFGNLYDYRFDAVRFSHKPAAIEAALRLSEGEGNTPDVLIWLDGDTVFKKPLTNEFLEDKFPSWADIGRFSRKQMHTEGGIVFYRTSNPHVCAFIRIFWQTYQLDQVFRLEAWDDCSVLDVLIAGAEKDGFARPVNLGDDFSELTAHPIVNSDWFQYVDHLKGNRKQVGQSHDSDFVVKV